MASLLVAAGLYTHGKIKEKKDLKKEKKRKAYEARFAELEAEHKSHEGKSLERRKTGESSQAESGNNETPRRSSLDSQRSHRSQRSETDDGPGQWVEKALKKRQTSQSLG